MKYNYFSAEEIFLEAEILLSKELYYYEEENYATESKYSKDLISSYFLKQEHVQIYQSLSRKF